MEIDKNSLHYKFLVWMDVQIPYSLCPYVRKVVFSMLVVGILGSFLTWGSYCMVLAAMVFVSGVFTEFYINAYDYKIVLGYLFWGFAFVLLLCACASTIANEYTRIFHKENKNKKPNIFIQYITAMHDKICPVLEFK